MDWTDTIMLDTASKRAVVEPRTEVIAARLLTVEGIALMQTQVDHFEGVTAALGLLGGVRATGRRVVWCDASQLVGGRQLGRELVEVGGADTVVSCGLSGREIAIGARDAGLPLANVVVCGQASSASEVLAHRLAPGDTVLLLGVDESACSQLVESLERRFSLPLAIAS